MKTKHRRGYKKATLRTALIMGLLVAAHSLRKSFGRVSSPVLGDKATAETIKLGIHPEVVNELPRHGIRYDNGKPNEPMNLVLFGTAESIYDAWIRAGWYAADPVTPWSLFKSLLALLFDRPYRHGPITPIMAAGHAQEMSFQKPTKINKFRQRHHARVWSTPYASTGGNPVWIGHTSYDVDIKHVFKFPPAHTIDENLDKERELAIKDLVRAGARYKGYLQLHEDHEGTNAFGDIYTTDGRAAVLEVG